MKPHDPDWRAVVERTVAAAAFVQYLGIELIDMAPGQIRASMPIRPEHGQQAGTVHAGVQTTLADHCAGAAAGSLAPPGEGVVSVEFKMHMLRPAMGERLYCVARVVKPGRRFAIVEADVHTGDPAKPTARLLGTMAYVPAP